MQQSEDLLICTIPEGCLAVSFHFITMCSSEWKKKSGEWNQFPDSQTCFMTLIKDGTYPGVTSQGQQQGRGSWGAPFQTKEPETLISWQLVDFHLVDNVLKGEKEFP